jgi:hypothetical protein
MSTRPGRRASSSASTGSSDWELGFVYLAGHEGPHFLSATRVAVLSYVPGGKVKIIGDARRDQLAVSPRDVILPAP